MLDGLYLRVLMRGKASLCLSVCSVHSAARTLQAGHDAEPPVPAAVGDQVRSSSVTLVTD